MANRKCQGSFGSVGGDHECATSSPFNELREIKKGAVPVLVPSQQKDEFSSLSDPTLVRLLARWPKLPHAIKAAIHALVQASAEEESNDSID